MRESNRADKALVRRVAARIRTARKATHLPLGLRALGVEELDGVLMGQGCVVRQSLLPHAFEVAPNANRRLVLILSLFNPDIGDTYARAYALSLRLWGQTTTDASEHDLFALTCSLPPALFGERPAMDADAIVQMADLPGVWTGRTYADLLRLWAWIGASDNAESAAEQVRRARGLYEAGRAVRRRFSFAAAEALLESSIALARSAAAWDLVVLAHLPLGANYGERGNYPQAKATLRRALLIARKHGLTGSEGAVYHEMFWLASDLGERRAANRYAARARDLYGTHHPWLVRLTHDVGYRWIAEGDFGAGLELVRATCHHAQTVEESLFSWAAIARAAGGTGDVSLFEFACGRVDSLRTSCPTEHFAAEARLNVARGLASLCRWCEAETEAQAAQDMATRTGQAKLRFEAESVLASVRAHAYGETRRTPGRAEPQARSLAASLLSAVEGRV